MAADDVSLGKLHDSLADVLAVAITETEVKVVELPEDLVLENGTTIPAGKKMLVRVRNAAVLNVALNLLKHNEIKCAPGKPSKALRGVMDKLPFAGAEHPANKDTLQ